MYLAGDYAEDTRCIRILCCYEISGVSCILQLRTLSTAYNESKASQYSIYPPYPSTPQHKAVLRILRIVPDYPTDHPTHFPIMVRLFYIYICLVSILPRSCGRCRESVPCVSEQAEFMHSTLSSYSTVEGLYQIVLDIGLAMLGMVGRVWVWAGCCCRLWLWHCRSIFGSWVLPVV